MSRTLFIPPGNRVVEQAFTTPCKSRQPAFRDSSRVASRKMYFHFRLSIQYVKFLKNGINKCKKLADSYRHPVPAGE